MPKPAKGKYRSVVRAIHETPWAIREEKLQTIRGFLLRRSAGDVLTRDEVQAAMSGRPRPIETASPKVAVINIMGTICQRISLMEEVSGGVSTEQVGKAIDKAVADGNVGTIVLNIDSPGGSVFGVQELAEKIFAAREKKRVIAIANSEAASAAIWIATAATEFVAAPSAWVGSIGVLMLHYSTAGYEAKEGFETTITRRPAAKAEGAAGETLTDEAKAHRQELVDKTYEGFVAAVAKHRTTTAAKVESDFGGGRMMLAADALAAGLIDRIATLEQVLGELGVTAKSTGSTSDPAFPLEGLNMNPKIFGALVRIGMCPITATNEEATGALARFFAAQGLETPATDAEQLAALEAHIKKPPAAASVVIGQLAAPLAPLAAEDDRAADITAAVRLASNIPAARQVELLGELLGAKGADGKPLTVQAAVKRIQTVAAEQSAQQSPGATVIQPLAAERDKFAAAARDALLVRTFKGSTPKQIFSAATGGYVDWKPAAGGPRNLLGLAQHCLMQAGVPAPRVMNLAPMHIAKLAMGAKPEQIGLNGLYGSSDGPAYNVSGMFSNILYDAANVSLRKSFDDGRTTYQIWSGKGDDIPDFKEVHRIISGEFSDPRAVPEDGQFEETTLTDGREHYRLTVWGQIFSHSWELLVNDQLGAFMDAPSKMGSAMKRKANRLVYGVLKDNANLADGNALFDADAQGASGHNNITTGALTTSADYISAFNTMAKKMREMKGLDYTNGSALNLAARFIMFPPALHGILLETLGSTSVNTSGNAGTKNIWQNAFEPVEDAELGAGSSGGSDVKFYTATDPNECDTVEYATLEGLPTPIIEQETAFDRLAIRRRIYWAFGVKALDYRGLQRHNGA